MTNDVNDEPTREVDPVTTRDQIARLLVSLNESTMAVMQALEHLPTTQDESTKALWTQLDHVARVNVDDALHDVYLLALCMRALTDEAGEPKRAKDG